MSSSSLMYRNVKAMSIKVSGEEVMSNVISV